MCAGPPAYWQLVTNRGSFELHAFASFRENPRGDYTELFVDNIEVLKIFETQEISQSAENATEIKM